MNNFFDLKNLTSISTDPILSLSGLKEPNKVNHNVNIQAIPLKKRVDFLINRNHYLTVFDKAKKYILERAAYAKKEEEKNENLQKTNDSDEPLTEEEIIFFSRRAADNFMRTCFSEEEMLEVSRRLLTPNAVFSRTDHDIMKIGLKIRINDLEGLSKCFGPGSGVFQALLLKNNLELTDIIGKAFKNDPRSILKYALLAEKEAESGKRENLSQAADEWASRWLDLDRIKLLLKAETLKPILSKKEKHLEKQEQEKIRRYQNDFKALLLYYFDQVPAECQSVFKKILPLMERSELEIQETIWYSLFQKLNDNPEIQKNIIADISEFLKSMPPKEACSVFYHSFVKYVPQDIRAKIITTFNPTTLKQYCQIANKEKSFIHAKIKTNKGDDFLKWYLFNEGKISTQEMISFLKGLDLERYRHFIFSDKKNWDKELFLKMSEIFCGSKIHFWHWIKSFEKVPDFEKKLALLYPLLSKKIRHNPLYAIAMINHYDLIRQCAILGDIDSLSSLKSLLKKELFLHHLTKSKKGEISGFSALCDQNKRMLLKMISDLPLKEQQALFNLPDGDGKTPLEHCSGSFLRMVEEIIFKRQYIKDNPTEEKREEKKECPQGETLQKTQVNPGKAKYPRKVIRLPYFEGNLNRLQTNPKLLQEIENTIQDLSAMSGPCIQAELREGWKHHGTLEKVPCAVKDIRGDNYRLGFLVRGDADKNQGKIAFLFLWTHSQYNTLLNKQGQQLVRQAVDLMENKSSPIPVINPGNSGR